MSTTHARIAGVPHTSSVAIASARGTGGRKSHSHTEDRIGRRLWIIDIENLGGGSGLGSEAYLEVWRRLRPYIGPRDHVVVGSGMKTANQIVFALAGEGVKWCWRDGEAGTGQALLETVDVQHDATRYETLVIASGDHDLADLAICARLNGMSVHLVLGFGMCAARLWSACNSLTRLNLVPPAPLPIAA